ncbi:hypothetical protein PLANTIT3_50127 [Plantibacter sp. T3]|nr:hypothetical protein PLANTIT3_50127 [Plantibacter sp. T3]
MMSSGESRRNCIPNGTLRFVGRPPDPAGAIGGRMVSGRSVVVALTAAPSLAAEARRVLPRRSLERWQSFAGPLSKVKII